MRASPSSSTGRNAVGMGSPYVGGTHLRAATPLSHKHLRHVVRAFQGDDDGETAAAAPSATPEAAARAAVAASLLLAATAAAPAPAAAGEWHPRRHLRRIKDDALEAGARARAQLQAAAAATRREQAAALASAQQSEAAKDMSAMFSQAEKAVKRSYNSLKKSVQGNGGDRSVYSVGVSGRPDPSSYYSRAPGSATEGSPLGWWAVGIALAAAAYAKWGGALRRRGPGGQPGRWVRDRSLGGRLVFVPDATDAPSPRPLWQDDDTFTSDVAAAAAARAKRPSAASPAAAAPEDTEPTWWAPPAPSSYVSASRKEELKKQAKAALKFLEDCKLAGQEYPLMTLVELRRVCNEGGGVTVRPSTESGRDAILRAGVRFAMAAALRPSAANDLGGYEPGRFVSGLATDLGVPPKRAITITHGEVAAACRSAIIDAEAAYRAGDQQRVLGALARMVITLAAFPLPPGSPEAEMVGRTIQAQTTIEFRRAVFLAAGSADVEVAPLVAEMLGFDPGLVMDQLKTQIAMATAAAAAQGSGGSSSGEQGDRTMTSSDSDAY